MNEPHARDDDDGIDPAALEEIVQRGPSGAFAVAGIAAVIVVLIFYLFYFLVYLPRGAVQ